MSFLKPKMPDIPQPPPPANPAVAASQMEAPKDALAPAAYSLISTSATGLKRRASTERTSLIGG